MANPFSKDSDYRVGRSLAKEAKTANPDLDMNEVIQNDDDFAEFLIGIDPAYASMDLESRANKKIIREKYLLYQQSKELKSGVVQLYDQEITQALGVEIPAAAKGAVSAEMGKALKELAQKDSVQFQRLKQKMEAYSKLKEELVQLESTFEQKVHLKGTEGLKAMKDRQNKLNIATAGRLKNRLFNKDMDVFKADFGRILGNRDMKHAVADFKHTYGLEKDALAGEFDQSKGDIKKAEALREKMDVLREYLLKDLDLGKKLIEVAQIAAQESLSASTKELSGVDRLDFRSKGERDALRASLAPKITGFRTGLSDSEQAEWDRMDELDDLDNLDADPAANTDAVKKTRRDKLRTEQSARSKKRINTLEEARKLAVRMLEGKGKKGGVDYSRASGVDIKIGSPGGAGEVAVKDLETQLNNLIKAEVEQVLNRASVRSGKLKDFLQELNPYFEKWRIGGVDTRDKVTKFMVDTLKNVSGSAGMNPVLKVQMKAFLAQRGLNPITL